MTQTRRLQDAEAAKVATDRVESILDSGSAERGDSADDVLMKSDPVLARILEVESARQQDKLVMIASESVCPAPVLQALSSPFHNLYAEGYPSSRMSVFERDELEDDARQLSFYRRYGDRRYYKGCDYVNLIESLAIKRLAELFATESLPAERIYANVQPLSGAAANNAVYEAFLEPGDTVMGMDLSYGGHLTHGSPVNRSGKRYRVVSYATDPNTGQFDWERMKALAAQEAPKLVIAGFSAFPWSIDWAKFREVADASPQRALLLADISHPSGLVAGKVFPNPIEHADLVSMTTHKSLCGPRGAVLVTSNAELAARIDLSVFPGEQGGPHMNAVAGMAVAFRLANSDAFRDLMRRVVENARALADGLAKRDLKLAYGGTDTHLALIDLKTLRNEKGETLSADVAARMLDLVGITCNKNAIAGDLSAAHPSGLRFGTTWVTQRGLNPNHMDRLAAVVADTLHAVRPFQIEVGSGLVGRGRLRHSAFDKGRDSVAELIRMTSEGPSDRTLHYPHFELPDDAPNPGTTPLARLHEELGASYCVFGGRRIPEHFGDQEAEILAAKSSVVVCDNFDKGLISVSGERAMSFLQVSLGADVARLRPGLSARSLILDESGLVIDDILVHRVDNDKRDHPVYWLSVHGPQRNGILERLRQYSDGYVDIDPGGDPFRKVDGPVVIEDLSERENLADRVSGIGLAGPRALALLEAAANLDDVIQFQSTVCRIEGEEARVSVASIDDDQATFEIYAPSLRLESVFRALLKLGERWGIRAAGLSARHALRKAAGLPLSRGQEEATPKANDSIYRRWIDRQKPWFVGRHAIERDTNEAAIAFDWKPEERKDLRRTPLFEDHAAHTKKWNLVPFAGWEMPVLYTSISEEHATVRQAGALFDVAHMGVFEVEGEGASRFLDLVTTNYVDRLRLGAGHYGYALDPKGSVLDDLLIYRIEPQRFLVVVNAANAEKIEAFWRQILSKKVSIDLARPETCIDVEPTFSNLKDSKSGAKQRVDIAFQGEASAQVILGLADDSEFARRIEELERFSITRGSLGGIDVFVARTGYTGENIGFELYVHPDRALELWHKLLQDGQSHGVVRAGLGSRDSTRTEAGFPLWGHELAGEDDISPMGSGYGAFVKFHKAFFVGREEALCAESKRDREIIRFELESGARAVRPGDPIMDGRGRVLGKITSCAMVGNHQIGLAYVKRAKVKEGARVAVFPLPRGEKRAPEKQKTELHAGDTALLAARGRVLPRFMSSNERLERWRDNGAKGQ